MTDWHPTILETRRWPWPDEAACADFARDLAAAPQIRQALLTLQGPLGAGKTTFTRHLLRALGVAGRIKSPSYAVVEPYTLADGTAVSHLDFYRFTDPREAMDAGLRDLLVQPGLALCEWPEHAAALLTAPDLMLRIQPAEQAPGPGGLDEARELTVHAGTARGQALLAHLDRQALARKEAAADVPPAAATSSAPSAAPDGAQPAAPDTAPSDPVL